jgi:hypothetical protein
MARKTRERTQRFEAGQQERRGQQQHELQEALALTTDDISNWWKICQRLATDGRSNETQFSSDLTKRPGWELLTPDDQQRVLELGLRYVRTHEVGLGAEQSIRELTIAQVMPDWAGWPDPDSLVQFE